VPYKGKWIDIQNSLQTALITVKENDTIFIPEGHYMLKKSLFMDGKKNVVICGKGMNKTIISFKNQTEGSEGFKISNCIDIQLIGFTMEDTKGDVIKVVDTDGIRFSKIKVHWTNGAKESNGAYGLYPVLCNRVLIEDCVAACASDAGIYVGQSDSVIVRNNTVYKNVAGIESENSKYVYIHNNLTYDNTGGILVFDLPGLTQYGHTTLVKNNVVKSNNHSNFAPKGNIVGMVPPGTGIMLLATRNIALIENTILNNRTASVAAISYNLVTAMNSPKNSLDTLKKVKQESFKNQYDPYPNKIFISANEIRNKHIFPTLKSDFGLLFLTKFPFKTPDIVIDGFSNTALKNFELCMNQNKNSFANLNVPEEFKNISTDKRRYNCPIYIPDPIAFHVPKYNVHDK
jgi:parallel beta-helix repeat protein